MKKTLSCAKFGPNSMLDFASLVVTLVACSVHPLVKDASR